MQSKKFVLELIGAKQADRGMGTFLVVISVNVGKDREFKVVEILKETSIGFFEFEILEETFRNGIVVRMPLFGKGLNNVAVVQNLAKRQAVYCTPLSE